MVYHEMNWVLKFDKITFNYSAQNVCVFKGRINETWLPCNYRSGFYRNCYCTTPLLGNRPANSLTVNN